MNNIHKNFFHGMRWSTIEACAYQVIFLSHQFFLSYFIGASQYGLVGTVLALIYFTTNVFNFGLDTSWKPFFKEATKNQFNFKTIVRKQILINGILLLVLPFLAYKIFVLLLPTNAFSILLERLERPTLILMWVIAFTEGIKRSLKYFLYLSFKNKFIATTETLGIACYVAMTWSIYFLFLSLTLSKILAPLLIVSLFSCYLYIAETWTIYASLPQQKIDSLSPDFTQRLIKNRLFNYANHLFIQLYSSNLWIPMFAIIFGPKQAGIMSLISHASYSVTSILNKAFGITSGAALSQSKDLALSSKQTLFEKATRVLYYTLFSFLLITILGRSYFTTLFFPNNPSIQWIPIILFFIVHFSENFLITYKEFFIVEEQPHYLLAFNTLNSIVLYMLIQGLWNTSPLATTLGALVIRIFTIAGIGLYALRRWGIKPALPLKRKIVR